MPPPSTNPSIRAQEKEDEFWLFGYGSLIWKPPPCFDRRIPGYIEGYVRRFWQASEDHRGTPQSPGRVVTLLERGYWETLADEDADPPEQTWGSAYRIPSADVQAVKQYLDIREVNGYTIQYADFYASPPSNPSSPPLPLHPAHLSPLPSASHSSSSSFSPSPTSSAITPISASNPSADSSSSPSSLPIKTLLYTGLPTNPNFVGPETPADVAAVIASSRGPSGENREYLFMLENALEELGPGSGDAHVRGLGARVRDILGLQRQQQQQETYHEREAALGGVGTTTGDEQAETEKP